jgi:hypothetical protein
MKVKPNRIHSGSQYPISDTEYTAALVKKYTVISKVIEINKTDETTISFLSPVNASYDTFVLFRSTEKLTTLQTRMKAAIITEENLLTK